MRRRRILITVLCYLATGLLLQTAIAWSLVLRKDTLDHPLWGMFPTRTGVLSLVRMRGTGIPIYYGGIHAPPWPDETNVDAWKREQVRAFVGSSLPRFDEPPAWGPARPSKAESTLSADLGAQLGFGWPFLSVYYSVYYRIDLPVASPFTIRGGVPIPHWGLRRIGLNNQSALPLVPILPGFLLNSLLF